MPTWMHPREKPGSETFISNPHCVRRWLYSISTWRTLKITITISGMHSNRASSQAPVSWNCFVRDVGSRFSLERLGSGISTSMHTTITNGLLITKMELIHYGQCSSVSNRLGPDTGYRAVSISAAASIMETISLCFDSHQVRGINE
jgi:hypothetical protein